MYRNKNWTIFQTGNGNSLLCYYWKDYLYHVTETNDSSSEEPTNALVRKISVKLFKLVTQVPKISYVWRFVGNDMKLRLTLDPNLFTSYWPLKTSHMFSIGKHRERNHLKIKQFYRGIVAIRYIHETFCVLMMLIYKI